MTAPKNYLRRSNLSNIKHMMNRTLRKIYAVLLGALVIIGVLYLIKEPKFSGFTPVQREIVVDLPLNFHATSTVEGTVVPLVKYKAQANYLCTYPVVDITTALNRFGAGMTTGTTTASGDVSLTNTSTVTLMPSQKIPTSTAPAIFTPFGGYGRNNGAASPTGIANDVTKKGSYYDGNANATTTPWLFTQNDYFVIAWDYSGATSTDSVATANNFTGVGRVKFTCLPRT